MIRGRYLTSMDDLNAVLALRKAVFDDELGIGPFAVRDDSDAMAVYALVFDEAGAPSATGRLFIDEDDRFQIGRVCARGDVRGLGHGDLVLRMLLSRALELNAPAVYIESLLAAIPFYARYGFEPVSDVHLTCNTPHRLLRVAAENINIEGACTRGSKACAQCTDACEGLKNHP